MVRRALITASIGLALLAAVGCSNKKVNNPIANVDSKQPDKVLFDRAMDAMKHNKFDVARVTLQTLINTYPDSEYIARAKLAIGDSWYAEGGSAAMTQAENEYKDFQTFFPNMPEAAEAQMKIAGIHYDEMEKPDRDFTHAKRAEEEYRQMILQYPDSPLVPKAKQRLLEVQEVLAEREFMIGKFYFMRQDYPASVARLKSLTDTYPLYSGADEALFMLGEAYQAEANLIRKASRLPEVQRTNAVSGFEKQAVDAYSKIITQYPATDRVEAAKKRLAELHAPIPTPTPEAIAQSKAIEASRGHQTKKGQMMGFMKHHPDTSEAAKKGEPTMVDPPQTSAVELVRNANATLIGHPPTPPKGGSGITLETPTGNGPAPENQPIPRSDSGATAPTTAAPTETGAPTPTAASTSGGTSSTTTGAVPTSAAPAAGTSSAPANAAPAPAPARVNDANTESSNAPAEATTSSTSTQNAQDSNTSSQDSSSKKKKKHGLGKLNPF